MVTLCYFAHALLFFFFFCCRTDAPLREFTNRYG